MCTVSQDKGMDLFFLFLWGLDGNGETDDD
jgi:hypothetical protein